MSKLLLCIALLASLAAARASHAADIDFPSWLQALRSDALAGGVRAQTLDAALANVQPIPRIIELDRKQPEFTVTFDQYLSRTVGEGRIAEGKAKLRERRELLEQVAAKYQVQPRFIVALWGMETDFGKQTGGYPVVNALATLAYDGRRAGFFRSELMQALKILDEGHINLNAMTGSWAGAMGQNQFMPSSFMRFAVDHDGDGRRNIWTSLPDVFASTANYLRQSGWRDDLTWGREVQLPAGFDIKLADLEVKKPLAEWQRMGVRSADGGPLPQRDLVASIVIPAKSAQPAFLVYDNYRALMRWNKSLFFATAVGMLSDRIGDG
jgi:membrane-bound lytic murein transglycosylase B